MKVVLGIGALLVIAYLYFVGLPADVNGAGTAPDPADVMDKADKGKDVVTGYTGPWWQYLITRPWFYAAVTCLAGAWALHRVWSQMGAFARGFVIALGTLVMAVSILMGQGKL